MLHVNGFDLNNGVCVGKTQDVDFYYFGNILAWTQSSERLHGRPITLRKNCDIKKKLALNFLSRENESTVLHFPFFNMSSLEREAFRPGWEHHKVSYVEKDPNNWKVSYLSSFEIESHLKEISGTEVWSVSDTHSYLL